MSVEQSMAKGRCLLHILERWDSNDLIDIIESSGDSLASLACERMSDQLQDEILRRPEHAALRKKHLLTDDLELVRLCGGAKSAKEERELYDKAMGKTAAA